MARLELSGITKRFGGQVAVQDFDLSVSDGELVTFLGPSGCGKTTTLRITAGFEFPDAGSVVVDGKDVTALPANRRGMGMVFQGYALFPNMSAADNIEYGLKVRKQPADQRKRRVDEMLVDCPIKVVASKRLECIVLALCHAVHAPSPKAPPSSH